METQIVLKMEDVKFEHCPFTGESIAYTEQKIDDPDFLEFEKDFEEFYKNNNGEMK